MRAEDHIKSISELVDDFDIKKDAYATAEYKLFRAVFEATEDGIPADIVAGILDCSRQNIYDMKKRYAVLDLKLKRARESYRAELEAELSESVDEPQ